MLPQTMPVPAAGQLANGLGRFNKSSSSASSPSSYKPQLPNYIKLHQIKC